MPRILRLMGVAVWVETSYSRLANESTAEANILHHDRVHLSYSLNSLKGFI